MSGVRLRQAPTKEQITGRDARNDMPAALAAWPRARYCGDPWKHSSMAERPAVNRLMVVRVHLFPPVIYDENGGVPLLRKVNTRSG